MKCLSERDGRPCCARAELQITSLRKKNRVRVQPREESRGERRQGALGGGGSGGGGGEARFNDLGLARAAAKVSVQLYTVIIHAPTSLPTHSLIMLLQDRKHNQEDAH